MLKKSQASFVLLFKSMVATNLNEIQKKLHFLTFILKVLTGSTVYCFGHLDAGVKKESHRRWEEANLETRRSGA